MLPCAPPSCSAQHAYTHLLHDHALGTRKNGVGLEMGTQDGLEQAMADMGWAYATSPNSSQTWSSVLSSSREICVLCEAYCLVRVKRVPNGCPPCGCWCGCLLHARSQMPPQCEGGMDCTCQRIQPTVGLQSAQALSYLLWQAQVRGALEGRRLGLCVAGAAVHQH